MTWRMKRKATCHKSSICTVPWTTAITQRIQRRCYSVLQTPHVETIQVTCGSSGHVTLNIHHPPQRTPSRPLIIYINPLHPPRNPPPIPRALLSSTVLEIQPRWSSHHPFPTPLHDTLFAYDHIITTFLPTLSPTSFQPAFSSSSAYASLNLSVHLPKLGIYGVGLGATLATSVALTECRPGREHGIVALAARDGVYDWSKISTTPPPLRLPPSPSEEDTDLLGRYALLKPLFKHPTNTFDAFASPILFFRTTGLAIPSSFPCNALSKDGKSPLPTTQAKGDQDLASFARRKAHLVFPPRGSGLRIPFAKIAVTRSSHGQGHISSPVERNLSLKETSRSKSKSQAKTRLKAETQAQAKIGVGTGTGNEKSIRKEQALELVKLMRRSVIMHEAHAQRRRDPREEGLDGDGDGDDDAEAEAERRVGFVELPPPSPGRVEDAEWAMEFFEDVL